MAAPISSAPVTPPQVTSAPVPHPQASLEEKMKSQRSLYKPKFSGINPEAYYKEISEDALNEFQAVVNNYSEQLRVRKAACQSIINGVLEKLKEDRPLDNTLEYARYLHRQITHIKENGTERQKNIDACRAYVKDITQENGKLKEHLQALQNALKQQTREERNILNFGAAFTSNMSGAPAMGKENK